MQFNNIQKLLSLNIYFRKECTLNTKQEEIKKLLKLLSNELILPMIEKSISIIGAIPLSVNTHTFSPCGNSALILLKNDMIDYDIHLDKSHISIHTYPDLEYSDTEIAMRIDIDLSTCGSINPMIIVPFWISELKPNMIDIDFLIRGYNRKENNTIETTIEENLRNYIDIQGYEIKTLIESKNTYRYVLIHKDEQSFLNEVSF